MAREELAQIEALINALQADDRFLFAVVASLALTIVPAIVVVLA